MSKIIRTQKPSVLPFYAMALVFLGLCAVLPVYKLWALLAALVLFTFVPKWFLGPDYTGQQFHWTVAAFLCLHHYVSRRFQKPWLVAVGAVCACFGYLAFPQSIAAFAVLWVGLFVLGRRGGERCRWGIPRGVWLLTGSCAGCGAAFLLYATRSMILPPARGWRRWPPRRGAWQNRWCGRWRPRHSSVL